jgi:hypothetical protein
MHLVGYHSLANVIMYRLRHLGGISFHSQTETLILGRAHTHILVDVIDGHDNLEE